MIKFLLCENSKTIAKGLSFLRTLGLRVFKPLIGGRISLWLTVSNSENNTRGRTNISSITRVPNNFKGLDKLLVETIALRAANPLKIGKTLTQTHLRGV